MLDSDADAGCATASASDSGQRGTYKVKISQAGNMLHAHTSKRVCGCGCGCVWVCVCSNSNNSGGHFVITVAAISAAWRCFSNNYNRDGNENEIKIQKLRTEQRTKAQKSSTKKNSSTLYRIQCGFVPVSVSLSASMSVFVCVCISDYNSVCIRQRVSDLAPLK